MSGHRVIPGTLLLTVLLAASLVGLAGCKMPPALTKTELDAGVMPKEHPAATPEQRAAGCRHCHREQPEIRK
jgi:hypothetical protein